MVCFNSQYGFGLLCGVVALAGLTLRSMTWKMCFVYPEYALVSASSVKEEVP